MKVTKMKSEIEHPGRFQLDLTAQGFWRIYPSRINYGVQRQPGLTMTASDGRNCVWPVSEWKAPDPALYLAIVLRQVQPTHGAWKPAIGVALTAGGTKICNESFVVNFNNGEGAIGFELMPLRDGQFTAELSLDKAPLFQVDIPIVKGLPTAEAGVRPYGRPSLSKKFEHDSKGRISKIIEADGSTRLVERDSQGRMVGILEQ